jgi:hypothetical protein
MEAVGFAGALGSGSKAVADPRPRTTVTAVEYDPGDRPLDLAVTTISELRTATDLPPGLATAAAELVHAGRPASGSRLLEVERHLDLTVESNRDAAIEYLRQATSSRTDFAAAAAAVGRLGAAVAADGVEQARSYESRSDSKGLSGDFALGVKVGGAYETFTRSARLIGAVARGPGGSWTPTGACKLR